MSFVLTGKTDDGLALIQTGRLGTLAINVELTAARQVEFDKFHIDTE